MDERDECKQGEPDGRRGGDWFIGGWDEPSPSPPAGSEEGEPARRRPARGRPAEGPAGGGARRKPVAPPATGDEPPSGGLPGGEWRRVEHLPAGARRYGRPADGDGEGRRRLMPAGYVLLVIVVGLLLAALLNAEGLADAAQDRPLGTGRSVLIALTKPLTAISSTLRIDKVGGAIDRALGREKSVEDVDVHTRPTQGATPSNAATVTASPGVTQPPRPTTPTADNPLVLWVGGDSMAMVFGQSLEAMAEDTGVIDATLDYHVSSGLSRPDFFDWPKRLRAEMNGLRPEVAVAVFGANDGQNVEYEGQVLQYASPEWLALYHDRVGAAMDILVGGAHRQVWWVGMPVARDPEQSAIYRTLNKVFAAEAEKRPDVHYVDTYRMFCDSGGNYADYLVGLSGDRELMRQSDGIHWSRAGGDLAADAVLDQISKRWRIE